MATLQSFLLPGLSHRKQFKDCQDRLSVRSSSDGQVHALAVADGVGSAPYSEFSSMLLSHWATAMGLEMVQEGRTALEITQKMEVELPLRLHKVLASLQLEDPSDAGLSTLLLLIRTPIWTALWHCGDGFAAIDHKIYTWDVWANQTPLAFHQKSPWFHHVETLDSSKIQHGAFIASDGLRHWPGKAQNLSSRMCDSVETMRDNREFMQMFTMHKDRLFDDLAVAMLLI